MSDDGFDLLAAQRRVFGSALGRIEKLVALALLDHWSRKRDTFPGIPRLAHWTSCDERTVMRALHQLEQRGAIVVTRRVGRSSTYDLRPLSSLPLSESHPCQDVTSVVSDRGTPVTKSPPPLSGCHPKEPSKGTQGKEPKVARAPKRSRQQPLFEDQKTESEHAEATKVYFECFEAARGRKPVFRSREGKAVKELLAALGKDETLARLRRIYAAGAYWREKVTITGIASDPDKYDQPPTQARGVQQPQRGGLNEDLVARARARGHRTPLQPNSGWKPDVEDIK